MMNTVKVIAFAIVIAVCTVSPVVAGTSYIDSATNTLYRGGASVAENTEGLVSGVLKGTFSLFNPCLDIVKGCTSIVLATHRSAVQLFQQGYDDDRKGKETIQGAFAQEAEDAK